MARSTMICRAFKNYCKKSITFTSTQRSTERSCRKLESTRNAEFTTASGLDCLRQNLLTKWISERTSNLITNNRRISSMKSAWKKWCRWCSEWKISSTRSNINYALDYAQQNFWEGLGTQIHSNPQVCNICVSWPSGNIWVGNHPGVPALMWGIFNKRPSQPEYLFIWDVEMTCYQIKYLHWRSQCC